jgi:tetratricopeptide (TPR) repeat protein
MATYDAFISYSHAKDKPVAAALQSAVQTLGKPWHRRRSLRLFRDDTSLSATPSLWPSIERALDRSRYLILLASPEAATSPWIAKEVAYWLEHNSAETLLIAITDGALRWDHAAGDFAWHEDAPLPAVLAGRFRNEPKWVDLRAYRAGAKTSDARFTELAADFAATIQGIPKEDLLSQEVRQQRRALALAWSAVGALVVLAAFAGWQWNAAVRSEREAIAQSARAERNFAAAKETVDSVVLDLAQSLPDVAGLQLDTTRRILGRAENAVSKLAARTDQNSQIVSSQAAMYSLFGDTHSRAGNLPLAADYLRKAVDIWRQLAASERDVWVRFNLASTLDKLGYLLRANGDYAGALKTYQEQLEILRAAVAQEPDVAQWRFGMTVALEGVGTVLTIQRDLDGALSAFREALDISRNLIAIEPDNTDWAAALSASLLSVGRALVEQNRFADALTVFREADDLHRKLTASNPDSTQWRRRSAWSRAAIGKALVAERNFSDAMVAYREALGLMQSLADKDPENRMWQSELSAILDGIGDLFVAQGRLGDAAAAFRENIRILRAMVAHEPHREGRRIVLRGGLTKLANTLRASGDLSSAVAAHREELQIARELVSLDADKPDAQVSLSHSLNVLGSILFSNGDFKEAIDAYRESLEVMRRLSAKDPKNLQWQLGTISPLLGLAGGGDDHSGRVAEALAILKQVKAQENLSPQHLQQIAAIEADTAGLTPKGPKDIPTEDVRGQYQGLDTVLASSADSQPTTAPISISFKQAGRYLSATYRHSRGGTGKGIGIITGTAATLSLRGQTENCPGNYAASFEFSGQAVTWSYTGQDCNGPVQGRGTATRTEP